MDRREFVGGNWQNRIDVRDFIVRNYTPYLGDGSFLKGPTEKTKKVWGRCLELLNEERKKGGVLDVDTEHISGITSFAPGYIDKENEVIVGLQTDAPLRRMVNLYGGLRMAEQSLKEYGYELDPVIEAHFSEYRKTHNQGVFDAYTPDVRRARHAGLLTGLPDAYGRGRIIGDYRRVALYGTARLIEEKQKDLLSLDGEMTEHTIRLREEVSEQIRALKKLEEMAASYGVDVTKPAVSARDAVQQMYMGYLAGIKENNGAATSLGRTSTFLDIYIQRDLEAGLITEEEAQELVDQLIIKLRLVRHLRTPEYNELFGGDPTWVTESVGGMCRDGRPLVTKNSFRYIHTLINLGPAPEPNLTVLWDERLPEGFKRFAAEVSIKTDALQYESDEAMRPIYGDDYAIACCVSAMKVGKQMQFFGARCNLAKSVLYAINGGYDEISEQKVLDGIPYVDDEILTFDGVWEAFKKVLSKVAEIYVKANNVIHYMHDKYAYEASQMALHDTDPERLMAFGVAGLSVAADSLSAIKYATVRPVRDSRGIAVDFVTEGSFPKYGNDDDRVDSIAVDIMTEFISALKKHPLYRGARHTLSALTITSNVMYGKRTGTTPDGRVKGQPLAPGANPMHGRDESGALASLNSVAKIPYGEVANDGVSNTFSIVPTALGRTEKARIVNLVGILDGYFSQGAQHLNVNILSRETLLDAYEHPDKYPTLTVRVSGYAVNFHRLSKEQQWEVIMRTFHEKL